VSTVDVHRSGSTSERTALYDGDGELTLERYFADSRLPARVVRYRFEPGTSEGAHLHAEGDPESCTEEDSEELYVVLSGELVMTSAGERTTLRAGDAAYVPTAELHGIANESDRPAELILVWGPPRRG
jgi:mannose-6-phosphate isomerase-like protein (cupin superfamily)